MLTTSRLVTLTGFGGVGKTRLALSIATEVRRAFSGGVHFVSLASQDDPEMLPQTIAAALGVQSRSIRSGIEELTEYLRPREVLLILDNCEHLIDAAAHLTGTLLRACPHIRVLATSREPLRIDGEAVHSVVPLTFPDANQVAEPGAHYESVALFVDRARAVLPNFELTDASRDAVGNICRQLEGIPLAIELAAVRLRTMSPTELASHLSQHWELLSRGSRTAPERQRTMAACIEWSFALCTEEERDVWAAVSVFADGFELDAANAVSGDLGGGLEFPDIVASLVDKSILIAQEQDDHMRFRMLPPIRHRGIGRLHALGRQTELRRRHRDWYVELSQLAHDDWLSPRQIEWIERLRREGKNLQAALGFCFTNPGEADPGLRMGANLLEYGLAEGLFHSGRLWFDRLLQLSSEQSIDRALALRTAAWWAAAQGDVASARPLLEEGLALAEQLDAPTKNLLVQTAALVELFSGDAALAIPLLNQAIEGFVAVGDDAQIAQSLYILALALAFSGDTDGALACHERCLAVTEAAGESWSRVYSTWIAGYSHMSRGETEQAVSLFGQTLTLNRRMNDPVSIGLSLEALAWIEVTTKPGRAAVLLGAADRQWDRTQTSTMALPGLKDHHAQCLDLIAQDLSPEAFDEAWRKGKSLSNADAFSYALGQPIVAITKPATTRRTSSTPSILTRREKEIAGLVAQGMTNQEIATMLVISKRTAETHVENILTKLGFNSRNQITVWMADQPELVAARA